MSAIDIQVEDTQKKDSSIRLRKDHTEENDGTKLSNFVFRALRKHEEKSWLDLLGLAFADKGTPREFFRKNMLCDPWFDISGIRVCQRSSEADGGTLARSVMSPPPTPTVVGG
eukprot:m.292990 g.292990  ORF g.292990 m.292990 type:complete len:113 (+) comp20013_c0_seq2:273-611(+)